MTDFKHAVRLLRKRPTFTVVAILTLALGIGANAAIFSVVNAVLLRPLPFADSGELMLLIEHTARFPTITTSWQNYVDWRDQSRSFEAVAAFRNVTMTMTGGSEPQRIAAKMVTASLLPMLRVEPPLGRAFSEADDIPGAAGVILIDDGLWRRQFAAARDVIGRTLVLDNTPYSIIGVLPPDFRLMQASEVLLPMGPWAATLPDDRSWHPGIWPIARLKRGTTMSQADAEMRVISDRLERQYPDFDKGVSAAVVPLHAYLVQNVRQSLVMLSGAIGFVLLIACANVANLLFARAVGRQKEIAVRAAIGADRRRIFRQLLTESLVLSAAGGLCGLLVAYWTLPLVAALAAGTAAPATSIEIDSTVLVFAAAVTLLTGIAFGVAPAWQTSRVDVVASINDSGRGSAAGARHRRLRSLLVVAEVSLATMLLVGAGLLVRSLSRLQHMTPGFDASHVLVADTPLSPVTYATAPSRNAYAERVLAALGSLKGVGDAAITTAAPFSGAGGAIHFNIVGRPPKGPEEFVIAGYRAVTSRYFSTLGIPIRDGRAFESTDRERSAPVVVVNETFARRFFANSHVIGSRVQLGATPDPADPTMEIVGVVGDVREAFENDPQPVLYVPYLQYPIEVLAGMYRNVAIVLKTDGLPESAAADLRPVIARADPDQPIVHVRTMENAMSESVSQPRLRTLLLGAFSAVAFALALIGVYGVMAYAVSERAHELGVRMALGASATQILGLILGNGLRLAATGVAIGLVAATVVAKALQSLLFGVGPLDSITLAVTVAAVGLASVAAAYAPARRAARIDPVALLR